jgi:ribosomal protein L40E
MKLKMTLIVGLALILVIFVRGTYFSQTPPASLSPTVTPSTYPPFLPLSSPAVSIVVIIVFLFFIATLILAGMIARKKQAGEILTENLCPRCSAKNASDRDTCSSCGHFLK